MAAGDDRFSTEDGRISKRLPYEDMAEIVDLHADSLPPLAWQRSNASAADVVRAALLRWVCRVKANDPPASVVAWLSRFLCNELITQHQLRDPRRQPSN